MPENEDRYRAAVLEAWLIGAATVFDVMGFGDDVLVKNLNHHLGRTMERLGITEYVYAKRLASLPTPEGWEQYQQIKELQGTPP